MSPRPSRQAAVGALSVAEPLRAALDRGAPVVALESSVLSQGLPIPRNREAAGAMEAAIRERGAEPAWTWIDRGAVRVGASSAELDRLAGGEPADKVARRDLPMALANGGLGATTVSATLWVAARAGIEVMATGGIGGVHPGTGDVSADLAELARTPGTVVCSGPKSIVDPRATLERLEELGVGILGYRCDRLPFFLTRDTDLPLDHRADDPADVADVVRARSTLGIASALLVCNPIPAEHSLPPGEVAEAVAHCMAEAERRGISGKAVTPFLLSCMAARTGGATLEANVALLVANAELAADVSASLI